MTGSPFGLLVPLPYTCTLEGYVDYCRCLHQLQWLVLLTSRNYASLRFLPETLSLFSFSLLALEQAGSLRSSRWPRQRDVLGDPGLHVRLPTTDPLAHDRGGGSGRLCAHSIDAAAKRELKDTCTLYFCTCLIGFHQFLFVCLRLCCSVLPWMSSINLSCENNCPSSATPPSSTKRKSEKQARVFLGFQMKGTRSIDLSAMSNDSLHIHRHV